MKAMIFAAGLGKRLGPITNRIPKALVDINGKSILHMVVEKCTSSGFGTIMVNVHHFADMVEDEVAMLNKMGYNISVSDERERLLDTGGGLYVVRKFFEDEPFLIHNVDIITDLDIEALYKHHLKKKGLATLAVRHRPGKRFYLVDRSGLIRGWRNKETGEQILTVPSVEGLDEIAYSSVQIVQPEIFKYMRRGIYTMTELYLQLAAEHELFTYTEDDGYWVDIGTRENLEYVRRMLSEGYE
jgi:N-acetyl-alpha-D-muramate 1-phosphate uridylyltransferase